MAGEADCWSMSRLPVARGEGEAFIATQCGLLSAGYYPHTKVREEVRPIKSEIAIYDLPKLDFRKYVSS